MKLHFDGNQQFQLDAVAAVASIFDGQPQGPPEYAVINLGDLASWEKGTLITPQSLLEAGLVSKLKGGVKILGAGDAPAGLRFRGMRFSATAKSKLEAAGAAFEE